MLYNLVFNMLYNMCYITFPKCLYNIHFWLYNIPSRDGYISHPNLPDGAPAAAALQVALSH